MGEYLLDWNETSIGLDSPNNAIPIPRSQHSQTFHRLDYNKQCYQYDTDSPNTTKVPMVPPNSLVMGVGNNQYSYLQDSQRMTPSPFNPNNVCDLDMDIKIEPLDELAELGGMTHPPEGLPPPEDNLLDNVNFEDLLMTDDMDASTTCLDPQHSSPAAMATVHPDEVLGFIRSEVPAPEFTPSLSLPVKTENTSYGCLATSFPPQGIGWREPPEPQVQGVPSHQSALYQTLTNSNPALIRDGFCKEAPSIGNHPRLLLLQNEFSSSLPLRSEHSSPSPSSYINNNNEPYYTQLETVSPNSTNSALHDLLVSSPQHHPQQQLSPAPSSLSPASPLRCLPQEIPIGQSVPGAPSFLSASAASHLSSRLSSSAPVNNFSLDQIWQRREPRQHLLSTGSLAEEFGGSASSLSTGGGLLSPMPHDLSIGEEIDSEEDSDGEHDDSDSDNDSIMSEDLASFGGSSGKKERHFWQYNVQAKGPKGHRVNITHDDTDPHQLTKIMDPVFSPLCSIQGIKHSGKARRGDGNDLTPSPRKLVSIGVELSKLNKKINEMAPVSELPSTIRSKSRKEKNKLASRACRLKKKAQHEANKIKLYGLEQEHKGMLSLIAKTKEQLFKKIEMVQPQTGLQEGSPQLCGSPTDIFSRLESPGSVGPGVNDIQLQQIQQVLSTQIDKSAKMRTKPRIAGCTTEFVNKVIEHCRGGNPTGGLDELAQTFVNTVPHPNEPPGLNYNNELYT